MNRIFGKKKVEAPHVNITDVGGRVEGRTTDLDLKVRVTQAIAMTTGLYNLALLIHWYVCVCIIIMQWRVDVCVCCLCVLQISKLDEELRKYKLQVAYVMNVQYSPDMDAEAHR